MSSQWVGPARMRPVVDSYCRSEYYTVLGALADSVVRPADYHPAAKRI